MSTMEEVGWILEYRPSHPEGVWTVVWDNRDKRIPAQSLEGILEHVKEAKESNHQAGHVVFHPNFQARIRNTVTGEIIPGEIFV